MLFLGFALASRLLYWPLITSLILVSIVRSNIVFLRMWRRASRSQPSHAKPTLRLTPLNPALSFVQHSDLRQSSESRIATEPTPSAFATVRRTPRKGHAARCAKTLHLKRFPLISQHARGARHQAAAA